MRWSLPGFLERSPWHGGHLQTLRNFLTRPRIDLTVFSTRRLELRAADDSGDRLIGQWHRPPVARERRRPLVILIHGLTGCQDSTYVRASAAQLLWAGFPVLRLNLRGAGPSRSTCRLLYHAGRSEDLGHAIAALPEEAISAGVVAVGYSLGGNLLLKYLGEVGGAAPLSAAVAVSAPLDLIGASRQIAAPGNALYHWYFLSELQREALAGGARLTAGERRAVQGARSLWQFDNDFTAPRNGFSGAAEYYAKSSSERFLGRIAVPTLLLHAEDDPIVPAEPYRAYDWRNQNLVPLLQPKGGHLGFHDRGGGTWHDRAIRAFFERALGFPL